MHNDYATLEISPLLSSQLLNIRSFMGAIAEGPVQRLLAITQPIFLSLCDSEAYRFLCDLKVDILVRAIAQWLTFALATETPWVGLACCEVQLEWFLVVYMPVNGLVIGTIHFLQRVYGNWRFVGFRAEAWDLWNVFASKLRLMAAPVALYYRCETLCFLFFHSNRILYSELL